MPMYKRMRWKWLLVLIESDMLNASLFQNFKFIFILKMYPLLQYQAAVMFLKYNWKNILVVYKHIWDKAALY